MNLILCMKRDPETQDACGLAAGHKGRHKSKFRGLVFCTLYQKSGGIMSNEFAPHRKPINAIEAYLDKVGEFTDPEVVVEGLIEAGFAPHDPRRKRNIMDSIRYNTAKGRLILKDGKVGKAEWANPVMRKGVGR